MTRTRQRLRSEEGSVEYSRLKGLHSQLTSQLESCRQVIEQDLKSNVSEDERLRHVSYFVKALKSSVFSTEMSELLTRSDYFDENFKLQVMETKSHLHEQIEQLIRVVEELGKDLMKRRKQANILTESPTVTPSRKSRGRCGTSPQVRHPAYVCQQQPGPSGCSCRDYKINNNVTDDGNTAFMVLEEV
ncbi:hypothetical protein Aduo_010059 [Ancylostoma duodenale]